MMTWANELLAAYVLVGAVVSFTTLRIFPPMEGFKPSLTVRFSAGLVFAVLWPFLVLLAAWYLTIGYLNRNKSSKLRSECSSVELGAEVALHQQIPISKPR